MSFDNKISRILNLKGLGLKILEIEENPEFRDTTSLWSQWFQILQLLQFPDSFKDSLDSKA